MSSFLCDAAAVGDMCEHPAFRGLWRSRCMEDDGIETGWSVTFILDGEYTETKYCPTKEAACQEALSHLGRSQEKAR